MASWQEKIYDFAPWLIKEWLVAAEAKRRNYYQRYGNFELVKKEHDLYRYYNLSTKEISAHQWETLSRVLTYARTRSPFYQNRLPIINGLDEIRKLPILTKQDIRLHADEMIATGTKPKDIYTVRTSGSTGTPLTIHLERAGLRARYALMDNYLEMFGCNLTDRKARFAGVKIKKVDCKTPPFWIYNRIYKQLQMSPYHLDQKSFPFYLDKINEYQPVFYTGYGYAYYVLAQFINENYRLTTFPKAIITDSEGLLPEQRSIIEACFRTKCYSTYGLREISPVALHCQQQKYHIMEMNCIVEIVDDSGNPVPAGTPGRIIVTDLLQSTVPYIRYDTGDIGTLAKSQCDCGFNTAILESIDGRADEIIITPSGRKISRVSHIVKPGIGILESQIAQLAIDHILIRVVPTAEFDSESMASVIEVAIALLGSDVRVDWEIVDNIQRTSLHKFKHVVREFVL